MKKYSSVLKKINLIILLIASLNIFAWSVSHVLEGGRIFGPFTKPFKEFIFFYKSVKTVLNDLNIIGIPHGKAPVDPEFIEVNNLNYNVFALNSTFQAAENQWSMRLVNLRDDSIHYSWFLKEKDYYETDRKFSNSVSTNPILLENRSLIVLSNDSKNLYRLDANSNVLWHNTDKIYHHSMNLATDGNIWVCASGDGFANYKGNLVAYRDDFITKINVLTGEILVDKSVSTMLIENGYTNFVFSSGDIQDPLHINDIEPALSDSEYWNKDDVFISLRHPSIIIHYRPHTNKIIRLIFGHPLYQHDVDISSENQISIFNNNISFTGNQISPGQNVDNLTINLELKSSQLVTYNFADSTFNILMKSQFEQEHVFTPTQGLYSYLSTGDVFVETTDNGKIYILNDKGILLKRYMNPQVNDLVETTSWIRIYENINF